MVPLREANSFAWLFAYNIIGMNSLPLKTKETAFQILNQTTWTNNIAHKSGIRDNPDCHYCGQIKTVEHLAHNCEEYSAVPTLGRIGKWSHICPRCSLCERNTNNSAHPP
jgi:hypothetical protein